MRLIKRIAAALLAAVLLAYGGLLALLYAKQGDLLYPGTRIDVAAHQPVADGVETGRLQTPHGDVDVLFLPAAGGDAAQPAMIFGHGNYEVIDQWIEHLDGFRERGIGVLLVEYPGYGRSTGTPSEPAIQAAMAAAYDRLAADPRVDRERIFGFGQSLGGGAVCALSRLRPLRALILQSTFPSLELFPSRYFAPAFLLRDRFDNVDALRAFAGPVLVIHGERDGLIPWQEGERLAQASPRGTFRRYGCEHACWSPDTLPFWRDAEPFLRDAGVLR